MSIESAADAQLPRIIAFSSFRVDLRAGQLTRTGTPIALRPKTWAVLVYMAERPGALVTKEELLNAVWPDVSVTPDTLTKSIRELRLALGDDSASPRFIETAHGRGFRFIGKTSTAPPSDAQAPGARERDAGVRPFVGRTAELAKLADRFALACAGDRQIVFVTGSAGVGKTTLVDAFLDSPTVQHAAPPVWVARASCLDQHGPREPYLAVLAAVEHLARRADAQELVGFLRRAAPTWLAQMPWLIGDDAEALRQSLRAARAERMLREFAALVHGLTTEVTLVLVLEDLQWSDPATIDVLAVLGKQREPARLLVIGSYRPAEVAVQGHVLSNAVRSLETKRECSHLPLHELTEADVLSYLQARFPGAQLPANLVPRVHRHTDGNPLFVAAVADHLVSRGWAIDTAPGWSFARALDRIDLGIPDDARRMIETQLERLSPADRSLLDAASIAGQEFVPQAIAAPLHAEVEEIETRCEALARPQRFLRFAGSGEWPDGTLAFRYAFAHELYRQTVYRAVPAATRQRLHRSIGETLESAYGDRRHELAGELANHFERGGDYRRALEYLAAAAVRAQQRFAGREAIAYLEAALGLAARLPDAGEARRRELGLRLALAPLQSDLAGVASDELMANCERAHHLCAELGDPAQLFHVLYALCHVHVARADRSRAPATIRALDDVASRLGTVEHRLLAETIAARSAALFGHFPAACRAAERALSAQLYGAVSHLPLLLGADPGIETSCSYGYALWFLGHPERALTTMHAALAATARPDVPVLSQVAALVYTAALESFRRNPAEVRRFAEQATQLSAEHGLRHWGTIAAALRGWARVQQGDVDEGVRELAAARDAHAATGACIFSTHILTFLAESRFVAGNRRGALAAIDEGLRVAETTLDRSYWPELWRLKGELLLAAPAAERDRTTPINRARKARQARRHEAERCLRRALELARAAEAKSLELRAATSLARAWRARARGADACALLAGVCQWFGAEATSPDLAEARALLEELRPRPRRHVRRRRTGRHSSGGKLPGPSASTGPR
jgi:DNA-binding winged helix-turn-helix (wHTH) protein/predicted ATPase